ncbi:MAG: hypothetical protein SAJ12_15180 [Jaaginema sp. PMC 1079.18]|nr:hypothetical protein [Jaaginema sp. PMC 1080.18]MEC4852327.1 hypothetical protein [Jaaginema sp. PMC 1079.18]MEC4867133.1 hypothetical protein [Jaaginema sp. PMC 1078.18]
MNPNTKIIPTVQITTMDDNSSNLDYWQQQTPLQRLATLEQIRREYHQWKYNAEPRLQRVYTITQR